MKFCPNCGKRFKDSDYFCSSCSTELKQGADDGKIFTEGLSQASEAAKNAVENAFNVENREKVKAAANEAIDAIKSADIEKGKAMATEGVNKIKKSKYGIVAIAVVLVIALGLFFKEDTSDEGQVKKIVDSFAEFTIKFRKGSVISDSDIEKIVKQTEPESQKEISAMINKEKEKAGKGMKRIQSDKELEKKYEEALEKLKDADYEISEINIVGDKAYVVVLFKNFPPIEAMGVYVVRKNDGRWYRGPVFYNDDVKYNNINVQ